MRKHGYSQEKPWEAVHSLVGDGSIGDRLGYARDTLLRLRPEQDFPDHLRGKFVALMADLDKRAASYSYRTTRINTRPPNSGRMAETILSLYTQLRGGITD